MLAINLVIIGILTGAVYALIGIGFTLVIGVAKVVNFAHGAFVALGMFFALLFHQSLDISPYWAIAPGFIVFTGLGILMAFALRRAESAGEVGQLIIGLAVLLLIESAIALFFGTGPRRLDLDLPTFRLFGANVPASNVVAFLLAIILALVVRLLVTRSWYGRAMRAVSTDEDAAALQGIRVSQVKTASIALSIALAGCAGIMISPFAVLTPFTGTSYLLIAFAVVVVGGLGNPTGAVVAGLSIGVLQSLASGYLPSAYSTLVPLLLVLAVLALRPSRIGASI